MEASYTALREEMDRTAQAYVAHFAARRDAFALLGRPTTMPTRRKSRWAFLHVPKTAGTMIDYVFSGYLVAHGHSVDAMLVKGLNRDASLKVIAPADFLVCDRNGFRAALDRGDYAFVSQHVQGDVITAIGDDYLRFTVLREPYERFASDFTFRLQRSGKRHWNERELAQVAQSLLAKRRNIYCRTFAWDVPCDESRVMDIIACLGARLDCIFVHEDLDTALTVLLNQIEPAAVWVGGKYNDTRALLQRAPIDAFLDREVRSTFVRENACDCLVYKYFCEKNAALRADIGSREADRAFLAPPTNFFARDGATGVLIPRIDDVATISGRGPEKGYFDVALYPWPQTAS